eukprot:SM000007S20939  [mRNA]  locus=s7:1010975:1014583:- [translate_table: standard]
MAWPWRARLPPALGALAGIAAAATAAPAGGEPGGATAAVHVLFRHGDRSPVPLTGQSDGEIWERRLQRRPVELEDRIYKRGNEYPYGQLTTKGAREAQQLGMSLRERYAELLGPPEDNPLMRTSIRSTDFPRTHLSGFFVLAGLLGSKEAAAKVPIVIWDDEAENLYNNDNCKRGSLLWGKAWKAMTSPIQIADGSRHFVGWRAIYRPFAEAVRKFYHLDVDSRFPWVTAVDNLDCRQQHGDALPNGVTKKEIDELRHLLSVDHATTFSSQEVCQLAMGRLVDELCQSMASCVKGVSDLRYILYSGHDATLMPLAASLGIPCPTWPPYSSYMCLELWSTLDNQAHFVRVLYNGEEVDLPRCAPPEGASWLDQGPWHARLINQLCSWEHFNSLANWYTCTSPPPSSACHTGSGEHMVC